MEGMLVVFRVDPSVLNGLLVWLPEHVHVIGVLEAVRRMVLNPLRPVLLYQLFSSLGIHHRIRVHLRH